MTLRHVVGVCALCLFSCSFQTSHEGIKTPLFKTANRHLLLRTTEMEMEHEGSDHGSLRTNSTHPYEEEKRDEEQELNKLIESESRHVRLWRVNVFLMLVITATIVTVMTYIFLKRKDHDEFQSQFNLLARTIEDATDFKLQGVVGSSMSLSEFMTAEAATSNSTHWPFFTLSSFEVFTSSTRLQAGSELVVVCPLVRQEDLEDWAMYSTENQGWLDESFAAQGKTRSDLNPIPSSIYRFGTYKGKTVLKPEEGRGNQHPSAPFWTMSPPPFDSSIVNYNALDDSVYLTQFTAMMASKKYVMGRAKKNDLIEYAISEQDHDSLHGNAKSDEYETMAGFANEHPHSALMYPVFEELRNVSSPIVAFIVSVLPWDSYLQNLLPTGANGIYCILHNSCGQHFTYIVDGNEAVFVGNGDFHESKYDHDEVIVDLLGTLGGRNESEILHTGECTYWFSIYPSEEFQSVYQSKTPLAFAIWAAATFSIIALSFFIYDTCVSRKNEIILNAAIESNAIVSSLFPSNVRDRLFEKEESAPSDTKDAHNAWGSDESGDGLITSKPNAELYSECTVLFSDLVGFTNWSSTRDPTAVFSLLENVYKRFDLIAVRRRVFKVETIGDCYVACTGLPHERKDHAVAMARFAAECLLELPIVLLKLESYIGADVSDLSMRFGLHSGPVTAGVLRGQKGRFQLFGDTVNTASRMESSGKAGRIHLSETTAALLVAAGKSNWVSQREEKIVAKGKGEMQTYWMSVQQHSSGSNESRDKNACAIVADDKNASVVSQESSAKERCLDSASASTLYSTSPQKIDEQRLHRRLGGTAPHIPTRIYP